MKHLPIPFEQSAWVSIRQRKKLILERRIEAATSPVEHFQALLYRDKLEPEGGLVCLFDDPNLPTFVNTRVNFPVDTIQADENGRITHLGMLLPGYGRGNYITSYQAKYLVFLPHGLIRSLKLLPENECLENRQTPFRLKVQMFSDITVGVYRTVRDRFLGMNEQERLSRLRDLIDGGEPSEFDEFLWNWWNGRH